jgi:hypothetical protein
MMQVIRQYKTISILLFLLVVFGILTVFVKVFDIGGIKNNTDVKISATPTPTILDPFIHPKDFNIPSSYMGYSVTKLVQADLGKAALQYGSKSADLTGTELVIKKSKVSDIEYGQMKNLLDSYIQGQLVNKGWKKTFEVNGQKITPNIAGVNDLASGFVQISGGKLQEVILEGNRDASGSVQLKLFLSSIYDLKSL